MNQEDIIDVEITDLAFGGDGVARHDDCVIFVPYTAVGDKARIRISSLRKNFARGEVMEILQPGPGRCNPQCRHYGNCVGCQYQHIDYPTEVSAKKKQLTEVLRRIAKLNDLPSAEPEVVFSSPKFYGYRNKLRLEARSEELPGVEGRHVIYGYYLGDNRTLLRLHQCLLADDDINSMVPRALRSDWGKANARKCPGKKDRRGESIGGPGALTIRHSTGDPDPRYYFGFAPRRATWLKERLADIDYAVPLGSFWQVNPEVASGLLKCADKWLQEFTGIESLIDAYAGVGTFSCAMHSPFKERLLIEADSEATKAAEYNLQRCGYGGQIISGLTEKLLPKQLGQYDAASTCVLLDPPRSGCHDAVIAALIAHRPKCILYVSCNPATLARDLQKLCGSGPYRLRHYGLFDMFPRTAHFETLTVLE